MRRRGWQFVVIFELFHASIFIFRWLVVYTLRFDGHWQLVIIAFSGLLEVLERLEMLCILLELPLGRRQVFPLLRLFRCSQLLWNRLIWVLFLEVSLPF